ncbi:uncharacterized protein L969DRAFT_69919 [Mixia osmundae IAM 14324]|uniref:Uncharacterized protein n=1 Tax=Mixia osmundae (strain CBS 9802 / IAM 14324 / JCM 22182 / KY 12970) TaxID=764103 RepID=G7E573_MIXOS|nr:uncharacterized protein L969DRAFT_69919 [Mixia osmundae IAM 14324]KEI42660.1 hypothetical protein L969DRAFT_69919 [Mixia osmundae IAM 14324]GAA97983.1 hypothetical protein E5Q_04663 [Mixia osmundae IAM 14324]
MPRQAETTELVLPDPDLGEVEKSSEKEAWPTPVRRPHWNPFHLPRPITTRQWLYILIPQGLFAAIVDGLVNFGIACAMYRTQDPNDNTSRVTIWNLSHSTVAGDVGVTVIIQTVLSFVISSGMVHVDLRKGTIDPFVAAWPCPDFGAYKVEAPDKPTMQPGGFARWLHNRHGLGRGLHFFSGSDYNDVFDLSVSPKETLQRLFLSVFKGLVLSAIYFSFMWPITIAIIAPLYGGTGINMRRQYPWAAPIIKLIFGFTLGLLQNPVICCIAMGSEDSIRLHLREEQRKLWAIQEGITVPVTKGERAGRPSGSFDLTMPPPAAQSQEKQPIPRDVARLRQSVDGSRSASPARGNRLSVDVAALRQSLDEGSRPQTRAASPH